MSLLKCEPFILFEFGLSFQMFVPVPSSPSWFKSSHVPDIVCMWKFSPSVIKSPSDLLRDKLNSTKSVILLCQAFPSALGSFLWLHSALPSFSLICEQEILNCALKVWIQKWWGVYPNLPWASAKLGWQHQAARAEQCSFVMGNKDTSSSTSAFCFLISENSWGEPRKWLKLPWNSLRVATMAVVCYLFLCHDSPKGSILPACEYS